MKRTVLAVSVIVTLALSAGGEAAAVQPSSSASASTGHLVIDPDVRRQMAAAGPGEMINVVGVLTSQADLGAIRSTERAQRLAAVETTLQAQAAATQRRLITYLRAQQKSGSVAAFTPLWIFNGIEVTATPDAIAELATQPEVGEIQADLTFQAPEATAATSSNAAPEPNIALTNAPAMWDLGYTGQGIVVANMDTGVDASHPDLAGRWRGGSNSWFDPYGQHPTVPTDVSGHGTWTMGVMVGGDAGGSSLGMAPDASWIAVKIFNDSGVATSTGIHAGFQWLLDPDGNPLTPDAPNVVNNSWTSSSIGCNLDFQLDLRALRTAGIVPVFAAGNFGPQSATSASPANNPEAFAVGATKNSDAISSSSSRGPSACDGSVYPEVTAPGVGVHTTDLYGSYTTQSGTSLAAPAAAGALALLLDASPNLDADGQVAALEDGAVDLGAAGADNVYGYGRIDVLAAYDWLQTTPDFSLAPSPSSAHTAAGGSVAYSISAAPMNGFSNDVSLSLAGLTAPQATWSFAPPTIPGGSGSSQLTVETASSLSPGTYPLTISGTDGTTTHTAFATLVVDPPPDFAIAASPTSRSSQPGGSVTYSIAVTSLYGFSDDVWLSLTGLPPTVGTADFAPAIVPGGAGASLLTVSISSSVTPATYQLGIVGSSGATTHTAQVTLSIASAADFSISISPSSASVKRGKSASYSISVSALQGFSGDVTLTIAGLPSNATATISPNPVQTSGASTLTIRTTGKTSRGTFILVITGASGSLVHSVTTSLTVT